MFLKIFKISDMVVLFLLKSSSATLNGFVLPLLKMADRHLDVRVSFKILRRSLICLLFCFCPEKRDRTLPYLSVLPLSQKATSVF